MTLKTAPTPITQTKKIPTPTGQTGLRALQAMMKERTPLAALSVFHHELGEAFRINFPGFRPVMLAGPEACKFVMVTDRDKFLWRSEGEPVTNLLRHGVLVEDGDSHDRLRQAMNPALHKKMMAGYVGTMVESTDEVINVWKDGQTQDMLVEMRRVALLIIMRTLFGVNFSADMERLWPSILRTLAYISPGAWLLWRNIPRPGYKHALRDMDDYLYQIIAARRVAPEKGNDLLSLLVDTPEMSDDLIRDQLLTMLIAGHDTSTALLAWALYLLGKHPDVLARAQAEVDAVLGDSPPTIESLNELTYLEQVIKETLRLYPPIHLAMRLAATDVDFQDYRITAGTRVLFSIYLTQRDPNYWPNPTKFDPTRFTAGENRIRPHYIYVPFGGGPRNCIGYTFAQVESKVVLARILQRFSLALKPAKVHTHMGATLEPSPGVPMQIKRR